MNAPDRNIIIPDTLPLGSRLDNGDWLAGRIRIGDRLVATLLPPKAVRAHPAAVWNKDLKRVADALSYCNGEENTVAMNRAGSKIAEYALDHGLFIPARDQLETIYRTFKPGTTESGWFRSGDNPSSVPVGYPYTPEDTSQTAIEEFRTGGAEALPEGWVWSSTQYARLDDFAWCQHFGDGGQSYGLKSNEFEVVLVRSVIIR